MSVFKIEYFKKYSSFSNLEGDYMVTKRYLFEMTYSIAGTPVETKTLFDYNVDLSTINPEALVEQLLALIPIGMDDVVMKTSIMGRFVETLLKRAGLID